MNLEKYVEEAHKLFKEAAIELGGDVEIHQAERITVAVLHTLREVLTPQESLHFIAQLPIVIKGLYVHGWHMGPKKRLKTMDDFIECLMLQNPKRTPDDFRDEEKAKERVKAVLKVIRNHISVGEVKDIIEQLPPELSELWLTEKEMHERYTY
jgi:uncharacterized protein (DUF2267 family)